MKTVREIVAESYPDAEIITLDELNNLGKPASGILYVRSKKSQSREKKDFKAVVVSGGQIAALQG